MATLKIDGMEGLDAALGRIQDIPPEVKTSALSRMADIAAAAIRRSGESMGVRDPNSGVHILDKITKAQPTVTASGGHQDITFAGSRRRGRTSTRNAAIAFVNEYGKRGQPARPFIGRAMNENADQIASAGGAELGDWLEKDFVK